MSSNATTITKLYEQIPLEAMQQVADSYMSWYVEKVTRELDDTIAKLRDELEQNDKQESLFKPSAAELESMRRLQANKVNDVALLDRLVERGEEWLVLTMQRLDYFERAGLSPNDYPAWCEHALSGAYDWIDAGRLHASKRMFSLQGGATGPMRAIRPSDLAALNTGKPETTSPLRNPEPAKPKPAAAPQPQRPAPPAPRPAPSARGPEVVETATQPVPIAQPAPSAAPAAETIIRAETAPLAPPPRSEPPRQPAPAVQAAQRPSAQGGSPVADAPTRPTQAAASAQEKLALQRPPAGPSAGAVAVQALQRRTEPPTAAARPQAQQPAAQQPQAAQRAQPTPSWNYQDQRSDPRYSLDDVDVEDLEDEGDDQGLLRKIFRVFTG